MNAAIGVLGANCPQYGDIAGAMDLFPIGLELERSEISVTEGSIKGIWVRLSKGLLADVA